jgi:hypothetical protein
MFLLAGLLSARLGAAAGAPPPNGPAGRDSGVRGHRGSRRRRPGAGSAGAAGVQRRWPARQGGVRGARARALGAGRLRLGAAGPAHHRQPRAGRPAEGRQPLRSAHCIGADGGDRRHTPRRARGLHCAGRARARRLDRRGRRRATGRHRRQCPRRRSHLPRRLRPGSRLGEPGDGDHRGRVPHPARQSFPRHAGARPPAAENPRDRRRAGRPQGHQGPGKRQACAGGRRHRRVTTCS